MGTVGVACRELEIATSQMPFLISSTTIVLIAVVVSWPFVALAGVAYRR
jgi:hypothetical protein